MARRLERFLGHGSVFFDEWFEHSIAGDDADLTLQKIYSAQCVLAVVCVSEQYGGKPWTLAEHAAVRARLMQARASANERDKLGVLPIRVGEGEVAGILFNTIVPDVPTRPTREAAELIIERLRLNPAREAPFSNDGPAALWSWRAERRHPPLARFSPIPLPFLPRVSSHP